jgi:hypothetical protein
MGELREWLSVSSYPGSAFLKRWASAAALM